ncbi:hypothetical protein ACHAW6_002463 [Cyclotella cf. meneghiniana]
MKLTVIIVTAFPLVRISEAIYLACCETTLECPTQYNTIDTYDKGEETYNACCYPEEEPRLNDLPECIHPIMTEDGVGISLMSVTETSNSTEELVEVVATNSTDELSIDSNITKGNSCCGAVAAIQPALRSASVVSVCPINMFIVDGAAYLDGESSMQVCCDAVAQAGEVNTNGIRPCPVTTDEATTQQGEPNDVTTDEGDSVQNEDESDGHSSASAINTEEEIDESSSATVFRTVSLGIALTSIAMQVVL